MWLVDVAHRRQTPNIYSQGHQLVRPVEAIILHYTGSRRPSGTLSWLCNPDSQVSAHFLVERDGELWQLASLDDRCWHAGGGSSKLLGSGNVNGRTIGIEMMNVGPIVAVGDGTHRTVTGRAFTGAGMSAVHKDERWPYTTWEAYPPAQVDAVIVLCKRIMMEIGQLEIFGHEDVDPSRKSDPGPAWNWTEFHRSLTLHT
jgi:N-acetylmuramoyl-L-alanine amidase